MADEDFRTTNLRLEQFLFVHGIKFREQSKTQDWMTEWIYDKTPYLEEIVNEYKQVQQRRKSHV